uniref:Uncharacterized protein n=1 Tax=Rhizophora mucronata TaxID=61149 RepID=A0A2P2N8G3_RHIMU
MARTLVRIKYADKNLRTSTLTQAHSVLNLRSIIYFSNSNIDTMACYNS